MTEPLPILYGDRVRAACTATGRYVGWYVETNWVLVISAMDNEPFLDEVDMGDAPSTTCPVPTDDMLEGAAAALSAWSAKEARFPPIKGR